MDLNSTDIKLLNGHVEADASGDAVCTSGIDLLIQDICFQSITQKGDLFYDLDYGWDLLKFLHEDDSEMIKLEIQQQVIDELSKHENVVTDTIQVTVKYFNEQFNINTKFQPIDYDKVVGLDFALDKMSNEVVIL